MDHAEARALVTPILGRYLGGRLTKGAIQIVCAWAWLESKYGTAWKGSMAGSHNWGAMQAGSKWAGRKAITGDTRPGPNGTTIRYEAAYRCYDSDAEGAEDMIRLLVQGYDGRAVEALVAGDVLAFAEALRIHRRDAGDPDDRKGYYDGAGATPYERTVDRARALYAAILAAINEIDPERRFEQLPNGHPAPPALRAGSTGRWVEVLRKQLLLDPQGPFPRGDVVRWQTARGIRAVGQPDGVFGPRCWGHLLATGAV